jgi:hypothetical protein
MQIALYIAAGISILLLANKFRPSLIRELRLELM